MLTQVSLSNGRDLVALSLDLDFFNVFIGATGTGKSTLLAALGEDEVVRGRTTRDAPGAPMHRLGALQRGDGGPWDQGPYDLARYAVHDTLLRRPDLTESAARAVRRMRREDRQLLAFYLSRVLAPLRCTFAPHDDSAYGLRFLAPNGDALTLDEVSTGVARLVMPLAYAYGSGAPGIVAFEHWGDGLNPRLARTFTTGVADLAFMHQQQILVTTSQPAVLDGMNLHDTHQRLFVVSRNDEGAVCAERIKLKPPSPDGEKRVLSELWMRGALGAIDAAL